MDYETDPTTTTTGCYNHKLKSRPGLHVFLKMKPPFHDFKVTLTLIKVSETMSYYCNKWQKKGETDVTSNHAFKRKAKVFGIFTLIQSHFLKYKDFNNNDMHASS